MFNWKFWQKSIKKEEPKKDSVIVTKAKKESFIDVRDYPKSQYSVYWEIIFTNENLIHKAEVRFITPKGQLMDVFFVRDMDLVLVKERVRDVIIEQMKAFKVA